jgi:hypothetical protein
MKHKLLLTFLLVCSLGFAQTTKGKKGSDEPDNKNIEKYLNDGRVGHVNNLVRLRLTPTFISYMGLSYERRINPKFGVEVGAYVKTSKHIMVLVLWCFQNTINMANMPIIAGM